MNNLMIFLGILGIGVLVYFVVSKIPVSETLKTKFSKAGVLRGRTKDDIIAAVGPANSFSAVPGGKTVMQWMSNSAAGGYHVALLFDANGICEGVTHEHDSMR